MSGFLFSFHQEIPIIIERRITKLVTEIVVVALIIGVGIGNVFKVESLCQQSLFCGPRRFLGNEFCQYSSILPENGIYASYPGIEFTIGFVVECTSAIVVAEFFIRPSFYRPPARETCSPV